MKVTMDIPEDLLHEMKTVEDTLGYNTDELILSAIRHFVNRRRKLITDALK